MGHNLSGGQKSRISLARAIYRREADIILIDATLSSLDAKVAHHVFENAIKGLCKKKLVILVTYDLDQAAQLDRVIYLADDNSTSVLTRSEFLKSEIYSKKNLKLKEEETSTNASDSSQLITEDKDEGTQRQIIGDEKVEEGSVSWALQKRFYSYAPCGLYGVVVIILLHVVINACNMAVSLYLAFTLTNRFSEGPGTEQDTLKYNLYLSLIIVAALISSFIGKYFSNYIFMRICNRMHHEMVKSVLGAHIRFFEENTQGRIINRFSKDIGTLDNLVFLFLEMIDYIVKCFFSIALVVYIVPWLLVIVALSTVYLIYLRQKNIYVSRDTMRLKSVLTSPVNSLIHDAVNGLPTLRCMGKKDFFMDLLFKFTDL